MRITTDTKNPSVPVRRGALPVLRITTVPASRTRDAVDEGSDLVITGDPAVLEYAGTTHAAQGGTRVGQLRPHGLDRSLGRG